MNDFDRYAAPRIAAHEASVCRRCDAAIDLLMAVLLGVLGALALLHWALT